MFGRRRRLPDLKSTIPTLVENALRQAINAPIQGTGSDMTLLSIIKIQNYLNSHKLKSKMAGTVHDSIVFDVYLPELPEVAEMVKTTMEHIHEGYIDTRVPILSELELGPSYGGVFEVELDTIKGFHSSQDYFEWEHEQKIEKYTKEIKTLHEKENFDKSATLEWMIANNRPVEELQSVLAECYS